jgi:hypothetical protein
MNLKDPNMRETGFNFWIEQNKNGIKSRLEDSTGGLMYFSSPLAAEKYMKENDIDGEVISFYTVDGESYRRETITSRIEADLKGNYFDSCIWQENSKNHLTVVVKSEPEALNQWKGRLIRDFYLENWIFEIRQVRLAT